MTEYINHGSLKVSKELDDLINKKVCIGIDLEPENFWASFEKIIEEFTPRNRALLDKRKDLQKKIDNWHLANKGKPIDKAEYKNFLKEIGYLLEEPEDFSIETKNVDPEIASIAGPQLVVPVMNARFHTFYLGDIPGIYILIKILTIMKKTGHIFYILSIPQVQRLIKITT